MPTLTWVGKDKVVNHHHDVPFRVLNKKYTYSAQHSTAQHSTAQHSTAQHSTAQHNYTEFPLKNVNNRIIHGDNLEALKSLLPEFEGKVNCIYIDPPYNTGNESWVYNDNVNDPKLKKWLGQVVGKEGEDLSRHDKWLCMMYPRLKLLHRLLAADGAIFISIDDNEQSTLKLVMDEIFGAKNFIGMFIVNASPSAIDYGHIGKTHDYALFYAKNIYEIITNQLEEKAKEFKYTDGEGGFNIYPLYNGNVAFNPTTRPNLYYPFYLNASNEIEDGFYEISLEYKEDWVEVYPVVSRKDGIQRVWRWGREKASGELNHEIIGYITSSGEYRIVQKSRHTSKVIRSLLLDNEVQSRRGTSEVESIFGKKSFSFPKPVKLLEDFISISTDAKSEAVVLDSFSGSGTTAHAVLKLNAQDGGNRRFILIEAMSYAETITAERVRRVMSGYGEGIKAVAGLGGSFDFYTVGEPLFLPDNNLNEAVGVEVIRDYVAYTERIPKADRTTQDNPYTPHLLGINRDVAWLFNYDAGKATVLDMDYLAGLRLDNAKPANAIIYADRCLLEKAFMTKHGIIFKKIPRDITRF
ncbi:MAG: site-specific DNA-methyltransferase [Methylotenera sp.]|nr:site-specific DNA-methyltransferase [Methylotenera sp.]